MLERDRIWFLLVAGLLLIVLIWPAAVRCADLQSKVPFFNSKRNPFSPPSEIMKVIEQRRAVKKEHTSPLQRYDVESLVLKGIVANVAMVLAPDGESYIIKKGTKLGRHGERVLKVYKDKVAVKRGKKVVYIKFPKD